MQGRVWREFAKVSKNQNGEGLECLAEKLVLEP